MTDIALDEKALEAAAKALRGDIWETEPNPYTERYLADLRQQARDQAEEAIRAYLRSSPSQVAPANPAQVMDAKDVDALWQELLEKDDRTSPAEYPDMALITRDEFAEFLSRPLAAAIGAGGQAVCSKAPNGRHIYTTPTGENREVCVWCGEEKTYPAHSGQAVAEDAETLKARAASVLCEAGALCGWPAPNCNAREGAEALFKAGLLALSAKEAR